MDDRNTFLVPMTRIFGNKVLLGNWAEDRAAMPEELAVSWTKDAIRERKNKTTSEYDDCYGNPWNKGDNTEAHHQRFRNHLRGGKTHFKLLDAEQFLSNMTSTNDVLFRIKKCEAIKSAKPSNQLVTRRVAQNNIYDNLESYGNATNFGLRRWLCQRELEREKSDAIISSQKLSYQCPTNQDFRNAKNNALCSEKRENKK